MIYRIMKIETIIDVVYIIYLVCYAIGLIGCPFLICMWDYTVMGLILRILAFKSYKYGMGYINKK